MSKKIESIACPPKTLHEVTNVTLGYWFCLMWHCDLWSNRYEIYEHKNEYVACPLIMCHNGKTYNLLVSLRENGKRKFSIRNGPLQQCSFHMFTTITISLETKFWLLTDTECHLEVNCVSKPPVFYFLKMVILFLFMCSMHSQ